MRRTSVRSDTAILLVEDDIVDVESVTRALRHNGVTNPLYVARNGEDALAFLRHAGRYAGDNGAPHPGLILLDLNMPVMNGKELLARMKTDQELRRIPVVVLTTSREEGDIIATYDLGVAGYIVKPLDFDTFCEAIGTLDRYWTLCEPVPVTRGRWD